MPRPRHESDDYRKSSPPAKRRANSGSRAPNSRGSTTAGPLRASAASRQRVEIRRCSAPLLRVRTIARARRRPRGNTGPSTRPIPIGATSRLQTKSGSIEMHSARWVSSARLSRSTTRRVISNDVASVARALTVSARPTVNRVGVVRRPTATMPRAPSRCASDSADSSSLRPRPRYA